MTSVELPAPIAAFFATTNRGDTPGFLDCFTADAFLSDWGRDFSGRDGIQRWNETDNIGVGSNLTPLSVSGSGPDYTVRVRVKGQGFNGEGTMRFTLTGDRIARLVIS